MTPDRSMPHLFEPDVDDATCRVCGDWPNARWHMAALSLKELDAMTIRTGCETAMNQAADMEMRRRGYRFDSVQQRWVTPMASSPGTGGT